MKMLKGTGPSPSCILNRDPQATRNSSKFDILDLMYCMKYHTSKGLLNLVQERSLASTKLRTGLQASHCTLLLCVSGVATCGFYTQNWINITMNKVSLSEVLKVMLASKQAHVS